MTRRANRRPEPTIHMGPPPPKPERRYPSRKNHPVTPEGRAAQKLEPGGWFVWEDPPKTWHATIRGWRRMFNMPRLRGFIDTQGRAIVELPEEGAPPRPSRGAAPVGAPVPPPDPGANGRAAAAAALGTARRKA